MISEDFYQKLNHHNQVACRLFDRTHVKGKENMLDIFQVILEEDQTRIFSNDPHVSEKHNEIAGL